MYPVVVEVSVPDSPGSPVEISQPVASYLIVIITGNHNSQAKVGVKLLNELRIGDHVRFAYKQASNGSGSCTFYDLNDVVIGALTGPGVNGFSIKLSDNWYGW